MLKKFVGAAIVMVLVGSVALADTIRGLVTKIDDTTLTITPIEGKGKEAKKGEPMVLKYDKATVKVLKRKGKGKDTEPSTISDFTSAVTNSKKGVNTTLDVTDKKVSEITFGGGRKGKKKADTE